MPAHVTVRFPVSWSYCASLGLVAVWVHGKVDFAVIGRDRRPRWASLI